MVLSVAIAKDEPARPKKDLTELAIYDRDTPLKPVEDITSFCNVPSQRVGIRP
jgi:hypothetical protein